MEKKMSKFRVWLFGFILIIGIPGFADDKPVLTIYAPDYFASEWGPGPTIKESFEEICSCAVNYVTGNLLPRLLLEGEKTEADIVIGIDTDISKAAKETGLFEKHGQNNEQLTLPIQWTDEIFLPFDWSYLAFVYDNSKLLTPPKSFEELVAAPDSLKIIIQDPRTSISGLSLALWVKAVFGSKASEVWSKLSPKIVTVTKGWSEAYGMFVAGESDMVLSYSTSPAYHLIAEGDQSKSAAIFSEGHYMTVELVGKIRTSKNEYLANQFMKFVLSETFQKAIPTTNWVYPAALSADKLPQVFIELPKPKRGILYNENEAAEIREEAIRDWITGLTSKY